MTTNAAISPSEFDQILAQNEIVLVDFSAGWCGPCKRMEPDFEAAGQELDGVAKFLKIDVDQSPEVAMRYGVQGVPNLTLFKSGQVVEASLGAIPRAAIVSLVKRHIKGTSVFA